MRNKLLAVAIAIMLALSVYLSSAFAANNMTFIDTYNAPNSLSADDVFNQSENVFVGFKVSPTSNESVSFKWYLKEGDAWTLQAGLTDTFNKTGTNGWNTSAFTPSDSYYFLNTNALSNWKSNVQSTGFWKVEGFKPGDATPAISAEFQLVPEPISTTLFLLGSGVLGAHILRKKKKTA